MNIVKTLLFPILGIFLTACGEKNNTAGAGAQTGNAITLEVRLVDGSLPEDMEVVARPSGFLQGKEKDMRRFPFDREGRAILSIPPGSWVLETREQGVGALSLLKFENAGLDTLLQDTLRPYGSLVGKLPDSLKGKDWQVCLRGTQQCALSAPGEEFFLKELSPGPSLELVWFEETSPELLTSGGNIPAIEAGETVRHYADWELVWRDEFSDEKISPDFWSTFSGDGCPELCDWGGGFLQIFDSTEDHLRVQNGKLVLLADGSTQEGFQSAKITSKNLAGWTYGRFEIRARAAEGAGAWSIISLQATDEVYGAWPLSGAADIASMQGDKLDSITAVRHYGKDGLPMFEPGREEKDLVASFHVFSLDWTPDSLHWSVDDERFFSAVGGTPFDEKFHLNLELAVGGDSNTAPPGDGSFSARFEVDWVRVYQRR